MTIKFDDMKKRLLKNPDVKAAYDAMAPEFAIASELIRARQRAHLSQQEVAKRMHTTQSVISRMESGSTMPSARMLAKYAEATGTQLQIKLRPA